MQFQHLLLSLLLIPAVSAHVGNISLNSDIAEILKDHSGNDLSSVFTASLGFFDNNFAPTSENIGDWEINWVAFTQASIDTTNPPFPEPRFKLEANLLNDGTSSDNSEANFGGESAWLWVYNTQNAFAPGAEWFLGRVQTWMFPEPIQSECSTCPGDFEIQWAISQFSDQTPVWGRQSAHEGGGFSDFPSDTFTLQTYIVIPEPGSLFLMLAAFSAASLLLYRRKGAAQ